MKEISKAELIFALTKLYQNYADNPEEFGEFGNPSEDAQAVANILFSTIGEANE